MPTRGEGVQRGSKGRDDYTAAKKLHTKSERTAADISFYSVSY